MDWKSAGIACGEVWLEGDSTSSKDSSWSNCKATVGNHVFHVVLYSRITHREAGRDRTTVQ